MCRVPFQRDGEGVYYLFGGCREFSVENAHLHVRLIINSTIEAFKDIISLLEGGLLRSLQGSSCQSLYNG